MNSYSILPAKVEDAAALSVLVNSAYRGDTSRQGWTTEADLLDGTRTDEAALSELLRRPGSVILKYVEGGRVAGCVELILKDTAVYLGMLTVDPAIQGKGVGKKLLGAAENFAIGNNCSKIYMTVISVRTELIEWYQRHGYSATGERKPFNFGDPRFGIPKRQLEFIVLEKPIA